jgi:hypothetical protein
MKIVTGSAARLIAPILNGRAGIRVRVQKTAVMAKERGSNVPESAESLQTLHAEAIVTSRRQIYNVDTFVVIVIVFPVGGQIGANVMVQVSFKICVISMCKILIEPF